MILDKNFKFLLCLNSGKIVLEIAFGDVLDRHKPFCITKISIFDSYQVGFVLRG